MVDWSEVLPLKLLSNFLTQSAAIHQRVMEMEAGVDAGPENFREQVVRILKNMGVDAIREHQAINDHVNFGSTKIALNQVGDCASDASVLGGDTPGDSGLRRVAASLDRRRVVGYLHLAG